MNNEKKEKSYSPITTGIGEQLLYLLNLCGLEPDSSIAISAYLTTDEAKATLAYRLIDRGQKELPLREAIEVAMEIQDIVESGTAQMEVGNKKSISRRT